MEGFLLIGFKIMLPRFILMWFSILFKNLYTKKAYLNRESPVRRRMFCSILPVGGKHVWMNCLENTPT